jgi:hypothetical protein
MHLDLGIVVRIRVGSEKVSIARRVPRPLQSKRFPQRGSRGVCTSGTNTIDRGPFAAKAPDVDMPQASSSSFFHQVWEFEVLVMTTPLYLKK